MSNDEHLDLKALTNPRKGWFVKYADDMPQHKSYVKSCEQGGRGFFGPNFGAHHLIPKESITTSIEKFKGEKLQQVELVQLATPYILNNPDNMLGLPSFWSFDKYYKIKRLHEGSTYDASSEYPGLSENWMNSYKESTQAKWEKWVRRTLQKISKKKHSPDPENHPIHLPVSWGHTEYNKLVANQLRDQVWSVLRREQDKHKIRPSTLDDIKTQLKQLETSLHDDLMSRGTTSLELWERRKDPNDQGWHGPYTMTDIVKNPIWG